jgi:hypothetical protein
MCCIESKSLNRSLVDAHEIASALYAFNNVTSADISRLLISLKLPREINAISRLRQADFLRLMLPLACVVEHHQRVKKVQ